MSATRAKQHFPSDVQFDGLDSVQFSPVTLSGNMLSTAIQGIFVLPTALKIYRLVAYMSGSPAGTCAINIVSGIAAELTGVGSVPTPDSDYTGQPGAAYSTGIAPQYPPPFATPGQKLLLTDAPVTMTTNTPTIITPSDSAASGAYPAGTPGQAWDALWGPGGAIATLRCVTNGSGAGTLYVALLYKMYDTLYPKPLLTSFNPATDIP